MLYGYLEDDMPRMVKTPWSDEEIPFETVTKDVSTNDSEKQDAIIQKGKNGIKEVKYRVRYKDGNEFERTILSEIILEQPKEEIIQISSKVATDMAREELL